MITDPWSRTLTTCPRRRGGSVIVSLAVKLNSVACCLHVNKPAEDHVTNGQADKN